MLILFSLIGFIPIAVIRATPGNPAVGILSGIFFGVTVIFTIPRAPTIHPLWHIVSLEHFYLQ